MTTAANSHRLSYGEIIERLTEKRTGTTSVTIKMSAQGVIMPEITITAGATDAEVDKAVEQAVRAFVAAAAAEVKAAK